MTLLSHLKGVDLHLNPKKSFDEKFHVPIEFDVKTQSHFNDDQAVSSTIECTGGEIKHYTFETLMQRVNLTYIYGTRGFQMRQEENSMLFLERGCEPLFSTHLHIPGILQKLVW